MSIFLKVKVKSLAAESRIIRREERRRKGDDPIRARLRAHRLDVVRREARSSLLAYGYLRGRPLDRLEPSRRTEPDWGAVRRMVEKYGPAKHNVSFEAWKNTCPTLDTAA